MGRSPKVIQGRLHSEDQLIPEQLVTRDRQGGSTLDEIHIPAASISPVGTAVNTNTNTNTNTTANTNSDPNLSSTKSWKCKCDADSTSMSSGAFYSHWDDIRGDSQIKKEFQEYRLHDGSNVVYLALMLLFIIILAFSMIPMTTIFPKIYLTNILIVYYLLTLLVVLSLTALKVWSLVCYFLHGDNNDENGIRGEQTISSKKKKRAPHHGLTSIDENSTVTSVQYHLQHIDPKIQIVYQTTCIQHYLEITCATMIVTGMVLLSTYLVIVRHHYYQQGDLADLPSMHSLPEGLVAASVMIPILLYMVLKELHFFHALCLICGAFSASMVLTGLYGLNASLSRGIIGVFVACFMLCEYHRQCWHSFSISNRLMKTLDENARLAEEVKANELRHMIGNVAHDLKTPLSSFISGMEVIRLVANELQSDMQETGTLPLNSIQNMQERVSTILEVAENVTNTNAFMIMTINRCIDYNKTLFGVKLMPKNETFVLRDSIDFIIKCLQGMHNQDSQLIDCQYKSGELRKGEVMIKSDKQWNQENLLCLIGNAVKYTPHGKKVCVEISRTTKQLPQQAGSCPSTTASISNSPSKLSLSALSGLAEYDIERGLSHNDSSVATEGIAKDDSHGHKFFSAIREASEASNLSTSTSYSGFLKIAVIDAGPGVDVQFRSKLFQEPVQAARLSGGTGLGLYSLAKRVETLGGEYGIEDRPDRGQGSLFWFMIPLYIQQNIHQPLMNTGVHELVGESASTKNTIKQTLWEAPSVRARPELSTFETNTTDSSNMKDSPSEPPLRARHYSVGSEESLQQTASRRFVYINDSEHSGSAKFQVNRNRSGSSGLLECNKKDNLSPIKELLSASDNHVQDHAQETTSFPCSSEYQRRYTLPQHLKVLVVDDSAPIVKMTSLALRKQGHQVITAENGLEAIKAFQDHLSSQSNTSMGSVPFDVVLMDFQMPIMDGVTAIGKLRELERQLAPIVKLTSVDSLPSSAVDSSTHNRNMSIKCKEAIIIGFSAKSDEYQIEEGYLKGMDAFLPKPFTISAFQSILCNLMEQQH